MRSHHSLQRVAVVAVWIVMASWTVLGQEAPSNIRSDDFSACLLDPTLWRTVNPLGDASFKVRGIGTSDAGLEISLPRGVSHDVWSNGNNAPRVMQAAENTDFEIEVKFDAPMCGAYQMQGLIIEQDEHNFLRFDFYSTDDRHRIFAAVIASDAPLLSEGFESYAPGGNPAGWLDTGANNSLLETDALFKVYDVGGQRAFGTLSTQTNIHSHYKGAGSAEWSAYRYTGRMMITDPKGGIGVTVLSDYPNSDSYYRLRRYDVVSFLIAPHPDGVVKMSGGRTDTGVVPVANAWYQFKIEVEDTGAQTNIRASVWPEDQAEPAQWQVNCFDAHDNRLKAGTVGLWSMGPGAKYWDDLSVVSLKTSRATVKKNATIPTGSPLYMLISRVGDLWTQKYSYDGVTWLLSTAFAHEMTVRSVGPFVGNAGPTPPAFTGVVDYFFNRAAPTEPEDGPPVLDTPSTLTLAVTGYGSVAVNPDQSLYYCDEPVTLTAVPDPGWMLESWSGDLSGTDLKQTLSMEVSRTVGATFVEDDRTLELADVRAEAGTLKAEILWSTNKRATSRVAYGTTDAYELGVVESDAYVTDHAVLLTGLGSVTEYHFQVTSIDWAGHSVSSPDLTFSTVILGRFQSDDFNAFNLNPGLWSILDPLGDGTFAISGTNTQDARLEISVPAGTAHPVWWDGISAPRIMQAATNTDFSLEVKFESIPVKAFQVQGVIIEQDPDTYLRFDFHSDGVSKRIFISAFDNGSVNIIKNAPVPAGFPWYMRVARAGDRFTMAYSFDRDVWVEGATFTFGMKVTGVGPFISNEGTSPPAFTGIIDYFFNMAAPISPEDGAVVEDTFPPNLINIQTWAGNDNVVVTWSTDEPASALVECGETLDYELGSVADNVLRFGHVLSMVGLQPQTTYNFRVTSQDASGNVRRSGNLRIATGVTQSGPEVSIWYGGTQEFGSIGTPMPWVNILGHASDPNGLSAMSYSLNDGPSIALSTTPQASPRLAEPGDFNVELAVDNLLPGTNRLFINAVSGSGKQTVTAVNVVNSSGPVWPLPYFIDWSSASKISDFAQVVDGLWMLEADGVRPVVRGYDRLVAIGDRLWKNYEVTARITVHGVYPVYEAPSNGAAVGLILRWPGHTLLGKEQPRLGFYPLGAIGMYRWNVSNQYFQIFGNNGVSLAVQLSQGLELDVEHIFKMRVESQASGVNYKLKVWKAAEPEPAEWKLSGSQALLNDPGRGCVLLFAHHVDATFGDIVITPIPFDLAISNVHTAPRDYTITITWDTNYPATSGVAYGLTNAYELGNVVDSQLVQNHTIVLSGLQPETLYHCRITSVGSLGIPVSTADLVVSTTVGCDIDTDGDGTADCEDGCPEDPYKTAPGICDCGTPDTDSDGDGLRDCGVLGTARWLDTGASNSMVENDSLFKVFDLGGNEVFGTTSTATNIHSHYVGSAPARWSASSYRYTGRMMITDPNGGIGVTVLSDYPNSDSYYRLRRYSGVSFQTAPHPDGVVKMSGGVTDTGVNPAPNVWHRFQIEVDSAGDQTEVRAKVWVDGQPEPAQWQVDCFDAHSNRLTAGTVGMWSMGPGAKYWDDLTVWMPNCADDTDGDGVSDCEDGCPQDADKSHAGQCGCGTPDTDSDSDGVADCNDRCEGFDDTIDSDGDGVPDGCDVCPGADDSMDADGDGTPDCEDGCPTDPAKTEPGVCGCGIPDFDSDGDGVADCEDPDFDANWLDTGANNSLVENDSLFQVYDVGGEEVFGTTSTATNIHSHCTGTGSESWSSYEYTGRMMTTSADGGIGVTLLSDYPNSDSYYRLRRYKGVSFHIAPHPDGVVKMSGGATSTGVTPAPNVWYWFRIEAEDTGVQTEVRAKVWAEGQVEPAQWQVDCFDAHSNRLTVGTVGLWSMGPGAKYWDDLQVIRWDGVPIDLFGGD